MTHRVPASKLNRVLRRADRRVDELEAALIPVVQPILERAGDEAARRFQKLATDHLTASLVRADRARLAAFSASERRSLLASLGLVAAGLGVKANSTMVAVKPRTDEAVAIADTDGAPADTLHVTLCFLGEIDGPLEPVAQILAMVAAGHAPLAGVVAGYGQFKTETGAVGILLPDVPGLVELRVAVTEALAHAGVDYARNHGYQAHLTVDADPEPDEAVLMMEKAQLPLHFDELLLVRGDVVEARLPLVGMPPLTASLEVVATSEKGKEVAAVAEKHRPDGGYGDTAWNATTKTVFWVAADWTTNDEVDAAHRDFLAIDGVDEVDGEAEGVLPEGDEWEVVYAWARPVTASGEPPGWTPPAADELVDVAALVRALKARTDPVREQFVQTFMEEMQRGIPGDVGLSLDAKNAFVGRVLAQNASQVTHIAETTRSNVRRAIKEAYDQGLSIPNTAKAIRAGMASAAPARARLIARTELAAVANGGAVAATQAVSAATGDSYMKEWMTAAGAKFPRHEEYDGLDGQTVPMDAYFDVGGANLLHPGDPDGDPAEVCNCRCTMSMVEGGPDAG